MCVCVLSKGGKREKFLRSWGKGNDGGEGEPEFYHYILVVNSGKRGKASAEISR